MKEHKHQHTTVYAYTHTHTHARIYTCGCPLEQIASIYK